MNQWKSDRRQWLKSAGASFGALSMGVWTGTSSGKESSSPNEKLNVACIGVAGRGKGNLEGVRSQNVVALCDVDEGRMAKSAELAPKAQRFVDFRKMLDKLDKSIDAIVVSTPDHTHAVATMTGLKMGKHAYCEKPLTHNVDEARKVAQEAAKQKLATQLGTQVHASNNYRRVVEVVQSGAIGEVNEVHVWVAKGWGGGTRPTDTPPVPKGLHWDLWLGPAPKRPYSPKYCPADWRRYWDFGQGTLGDMGCHYVDLPFWALGLDHPESIKAEGPKISKETAPLGLKVTYQFAKKGDRPATKLMWYDNNACPKELHGVPLAKSGVLFVGNKGQLHATYHGYKLYPEADFVDFKAPKQSIPASLGHHQEWIKACKDGSPTTCSFDYGGMLTETVLLGNVAFRVGEEIKWDAKGLRCPGCPAADEFLRREYRKGWSL